MSTNQTEQVKTCTKCLIVKSVNEFNKNITRKDGFASWCKPCNRLDKKRYAQINREKISEQTKKWRKNNPEKVKEKKLRYYLKNREKINEQTKKWRKNNPDKVKVCKSMYYAKNREKEIDRAVKWAIDNPEKSKDIKAIWYVKNAEITKERAVEWGKNNSEKIKAQSRKKSQKDCLNLTDYYIINGLSVQSGFSSQIIRNIPGLIAMKRKQLKYQRIIKQQKKQNYETSEQQESFCHTMQMD